MSFTLNRKSKRDGKKLETENQVTNRMKTKPTLLLSLTFLFLFNNVVSGETENFNIATGTGFFLGSSNYVVTNYHVIHGAKKIQVKLINGEILVAEVVLKSPDKDI